MRVYSIIVIALALRYRKHKVWKLRCLDFWPSCHHFCTHNTSFGVSPRLCKQKHHRRLLLFAFDATPPSFSSPSSPSPSSPSSSSRHRPRSVLRASAFRSAVQQLSVSVSWFGELGPSARAGRVISPGSHLRLRPRPRLTLHSLVKPGD